MAGTRRIEGAGSSNTNDRIHQPRFVVGRKWHGGGKLSRPRPPTIEQRLYTNSQDGSGDISAIYDQVEPVNSEDGSSRFLRLHPQSGDGAWVQYDFAKPAKVSSVEVYWKDDKQYCILPEAWRLLYRDGSDWKAVQALDSYAVAKDKFNKVSFQPVTTSALRIEIQLQGRTY